TWAYANEFMTPRMMVINQLDKEHADFGMALDSARSTFSRAIVPFTLPIGQEKDFKGVVDIVHMKAYEFDAEGKAKEIDIPEAGRDVVDKERERLIEVIAESDGGEPPTRQYRSSEPFSAYVFRTIADPFAGRITVIKVVSGHVKHDATVQNITRGVAERLGALHSIQGKQLDKVDEANAGDIIACVKLKETQTGDTLADKAAPIVYDQVT